MSARTDKPKIRERKIRGKIYYVADLGRIDGKRKILTRASRSEVELEVEQVRRRKKKIGGDALRLSEGDLRDAARALESLGGQATISEAVRFFLDHGKGEGGETTVRRLYDLYVKDRKDAHRTKRTLKDIEHRLGRFASDYGDIPAHQITTSDIQEWLGRQNGGATTRKNFRTHLSGLFNFAIKRGYVRLNPVSAVSTVKIRSDKRPGILSVPQTRHLMRTVSESESDMVVWFALCLFAGLRPSEAQRLDWSDIDLDRNEIFVSAEVSKTPYERYVKLQPNLIEWLLPFRQKSGQVHYSESAYRRARKQAGIEWSHDVMRHTFGTMHLAAFRNAGDTAEQMGHRSSTVMLFSHYRRAVRQEDAERFWDIRPADNNVAMEA
jgi:integrase